MNIRLQYSLTPDDLFEFQRNYARISKKPAARRPLRMSISMFGWVLVLALAIILFVAFHDRSPKPAAAPATNSSSGWFMIVPYLVIFVVVWWWYFLRARFSKSTIKKAFESDPGMAERHEATLCDEHLTIRTETMTRVQTWTHFTRFAETDALFVLMVSSGAADLIPKRAFGSAPEFEEFRGFALAHIGNEPVGFPVQGLGIQKSEDPENPSDGARTMT